MRITNAQMGETAGSFREFDANSARGRAYGTTDTGRLYVRAPESLRSADYTVWSYATPIAWHHPGTGWVIPDVKHSSTTSRHQSILRRALPDHRTDWQD